MNVQYTVGKNIPLADYLSRHPITWTGESETENNANRQGEVEAEEEFKINQIYGLFDFNRTIKNYAIHRAILAITTNRPITTRHAYTTNRTDRSSEFFFTKQLQLDQFSQTTAKM